MTPATACEADPIRTFEADSLAVAVYADQDSLVRSVAGRVQRHLSGVIRAKGTAAAILATGNSQIRFLDHLVRLGGVDWSRVTLFHMDEYLGIAGDHPASFRRYMRERVEARLHPRAFHYLEGDCLLPGRECERYARLLAAQPVDLCCMGIGENGHLAFNDPPVADFEDRDAVKVVKLDDACKQQQVQEGHFPSLESVPPYALTLTIPALCAATQVVCIAPERRKAKAVRDALRGPVSTACPASFLRTQPQATLFLDCESSSLL